MAVIPIIIVLVQIIILFIFFGMASNVSEIKKNINRRPTLKEYLDMAEEEKYIGNKEKAKEFFLRAKFNVENMKENVFVFTPGYGWNKEVIAKIEKELAEL